MNMVLARILRTLAVIACLAMGTSFAMYGLDQAGGASHDAQAQVDAAGAQAIGPAVRRADHNAARQAVDDANDVLAAPFTALAPGASGSWGTHIVALFAGLLVYGFGLGALARAAGLSRRPHVHSQKRWAGGF